MSSRSASLKKIILLLQTQIRVAGGWVRDKLLGKVFHDIDIALDNMMGTQFVDKFKEYLLSIGEDVQGFCVVKSKPEHSKHLETDKIRASPMQDSILGVNFSTCQILIETSM